MLVDSNIIIYAIDLDRRDLREFIADQVTALSVITLIEVYGYHRITQAKIEQLDRMLSQFEIVPLTDEIAERAIQLRQRRRMSLGDAIIAATALIEGLSLATHNIKDFDWIEGLQIVDPV